MRDISRLINFVIWFAHSNNLIAGATTYIDLTVTCRNTKNTVKQLSDDGMCYSGRLAALLRSRIFTSSSECTFWKEKKRKKEKLKNLFKFSYIYD